MRTTGPSRFPIENYRRLHESGFLTLSAPAALGGGGASVREMVAALERLARGDGATALVAAMSVEPARPGARPEGLAGSGLRTLGA